MTLPEEFPPFCPSQQALGQSLGAKSYFLKFLYLLLLGLNERSRMKDTLAHITSG